MYRHGITVDVACFADTPETYSRAIRRHYRIASPDGDPDRFVEGLRAIIRKGAHDMVIPTDDQTLFSLAEHHDALKEVAHLGCPPLDITRNVLDKSATLHAAQGCGIRIPKTREISSARELIEIASTVTFPCVLKPSKKDMKVENTKSVILNSFEDIEAKLPSSEFVTPMLLQEFCPGYGVGVEVLLQGKACLARFQHRRLKELPYTGGFSVSAISERPDPRLLEQSLALLRAIGWQGPAMVEYKIDPQRGPVLMEINGRYWGTISLPILSGVDFPLYHWQAVHGIAPTVATEYQAGTKWNWTAGQIHRLHGLVVTARKSKDARKELFQWKQNDSATEIAASREAIFSSTDPLPAIYEVIQTLSYLAAYDFDALKKRLSQRPRDRAVRTGFSASGN